MDIIKRPSYIKITGYEHDPKNMGSLEKALSYYDVHEFKYTNKIFRYDKENKELFVNRGLGINEILYRLSRDGIRINKIINEERNYTRYNNIEYTLKPNVTPKNKSQLQVINFLLGKKADNYSPQKMVTVKTGFGKTFCTIYSIVQMKLPVLIISATLSSTWVEEINKFVEVNENDIYIIRGISSLNSLLEENSPNYKFYIATTRTLTNYIKEGFSLNNLLDHCRIGVKVIDEIHQSFREYCYIDTSVNIKHNWYLTATPGRSINIEDRIFKKIYKEIPTFFGHDKSNHFNVILVNYNTYPLPYMINMASTKRGFNSHIYFNQIMKKNENIFYILAILWNFIKKILERDEISKVLIIFSRNEDIKIYKDLFEKHYKQKVGMYTTLIPKNKRDSELENRIILSTPGSSTVGLNIKNLRAIFALTPFSSKIIIEQLIGRLREIKDKEVYYFDFVDEGYPATLGQRKQRMVILKKATPKPIKTFNFNIHEVLKNGI